MGARGKFYAIDAGCWWEAAKLGRNTLAALNVLACGTGRDNRTTEWSANAVAKYAGMRTAAAKELLGHLQAHGLADCIKAGRKPRYKLRTWREIRAARERDSSAAADLLKLNGQTPKLEGEKLSTARSLSQEGLLNEPESGIFEAARPSWIWLPNELVTGAGIETPPIKRLLRAKCENSLALMGAFYAAHDLVESYGVDPLLTWQQHDLELVRDVAQWNVYQYAAGGRIWVSGEHKDLSQFYSSIVGGNKSGKFFEAMGTVTDSGLASWKPVVLAGPREYGELMHPLDEELGSLADDAAQSLLFESDLRNTDPGSLLIPILREIEAPTVLSVLRMKYRPKTSFTAAWIARDRNGRPSWTDHYQAIYSQGYRIRENSGAGINGVGHG